MFKNILLPTDGSEQSQRAVRSGIDLAKIHGAKVTDKNLHYTGSLGVDANLLEASAILPHEKVQIVNLSNGERMETYVIRGEPGSGQIVLNGGMALKGNVGDSLIIIAYGLVDDAGARALRPKVLIIASADNRRFTVQEG